MFSKVFGGSGKSKSKSAVLVPPKIPDPENVFRMPSEEDPHEGTWLQWPHSNHPKNKGPPGPGSNRHNNKVQRYQEAWLQITLALHTGERVHIIVYNEEQRASVQELLVTRKCNMTQIDFYCWPTNDVWIRDNGPVFCLDSSSTINSSSTGQSQPNQQPNQQQHQQLHVTNWGFNGWGGKYPSDLDHEIPSRVASALELPMTTIPMVNEGGSVEIDGHGTLLAKRSSILNKNRNPGWTQPDAEAYFRRYLGVTNFIWLEGTKGGRLDVTDDHIDGTARFANNGTAIVTFARDDFLVKKEYDILKQAKNAKGESYKMVHLPLTKRKIYKGEYGFYINYYVGNQVVLLPSFDDPQDLKAADMLQALYPNRKVVSVPMTEVFKDGGMVHCVTQQQPMARP
jgi:agmatine deiminase